MTTPLIISIIFSCLTPSYRLGAQLEYKDHKLELKRDNIQEKFQDFIHRLSGEIISIIPNVKPTFQLMGATAKVDFLLLVEISR